MSSNNRIFCPRCATENASDQSYCRQCGLGLSGIQWVLDGNVPETQKRLQSAEKWIKAGNAILTAFITVAVTIAILGVVGPNPTLSVIAMINVFGGALIAFPFSCFGNAKLAKAKRLLSQAGVNQQLAIKGTEKKNLPASQTSSLPPLLNRGSVTEHTTLHLNKSNNARTER